MKIDLVNAAYTDEKCLFQEQWKQSRMQQNNEKNGMERHTSNLSHDNSFYGKYTCLEPGMLDCESVLVMEKIVLWPHLHEQKTYHRKLVIEKIACGAGVIHTGIFW